MVIIVGEVFEFAIEKFVCFFNGLVCVTSSFDYATRRTFVAPLRTVDFIEEKFWSVCFAPCGVEV